MIKKGFNDMVKHHFIYLISDYDFSVSEEIHSSGNPLSRGMVVYVSNFNKANLEVKQILIRIILDRGYVNIDIGSIDMNNREFFDLTEIMKVMVPDLDINEKVDFSNNPYEIIDLQIIKLSDLLCRYCVSFLKGDFSTGDRVIESRLKVREERIKNWKNKNLQNSLKSFVVKKSER